MNCPKCFGPLRPNQSFCPHCGTPVGAADFEVEKTVAADAAELNGFDGAQQPEPQQSPWQQPANPWNQPTQQPEMPQPDPWSQPTQQPEMPQPDPWSQPTQQPEMPQPDPWAQPQQNNWQQPNAQQSNWQQPNAQQNNWQQPNAQQNNWQQPAQPSNNYAQQYQQYRQSSNAGTRKGDGSLPPEKNNKPLIIIVIVLAVLLIGGGIVAAVMIVNGVKNSGQGGGASSTVSAVSSQTSPQSSLIGFDSSAPQQSSGNPIPFGSSSTQSSLILQSSRPEESFRTESSRTESSSASSSPSMDSSHRVVNRNGLTLVEDEEIDVEDAEAQAVLERYLRENNVETSMSSGTLEGRLYPQGNALVYEYSYTAALTPEQEKTIQNTVQDMDSYTGSMVSEYQDETGVDDLVVVYAYVSVDGRLIAAAACHGE